MIEKMVSDLVALRERKGRLWLAGLGGSAANASHAANDFRKLCGIEAYCLTDNVSELTARANDEGWAEAFSLDYAKEGDALLVFSVGGGTENVSKPITTALEIAVARGMRILGVVGRNGGQTLEVGDSVVVVPTVDSAHITPHTEAFQAVVWHCLVSHPSLQRRPTKW
jgi:D-sedoheptulose 7-phosphate isomerase